MCSSLLSSVFPVFVCRIPVVSKEIQSQPFSNEDTAPRAPFLVTIPTRSCSRRRRSERSVVYQYTLQQPVQVSFFHTTVSFHSVFCLFSTVYDRTPVRTSYVSYVPYEIFKNFKFNQPLALALAPGPRALAPGWVIWPMPLAPGWVIWDPVSGPGYSAPGIWASWVRYLAPAPGPWPPAPVRRGICHQILDQIFQIYCI